MTISTPQRIRIKLTSPHPEGIARYETIEKCGGTFDSEGLPRNCYDGCQAHFDSCASGLSEYKDRSMYYSPYPNCLLTAAMVQPNANVVDLSADSDSPYPTQVTLLEVPGLIDAGEDAQTAWVVVREARDESQLSVHLALSMCEARAMFDVIKSEFDDW